MPRYTVLSDTTGGYPTSQMYYPTKRVKYGGGSGGSTCSCANQSVGARIGSYVGNTAQNWLRNWTGWGDYQLNTNSLVTGGGGVSGINPSFSKVSDREVVIRYKEYIGDVFTHPVVAGTFYQQSYAINPGIADTFPWFSTVANQYQQWKPRGILFEFVSTSGEITNNQALGKIIMATDYNTTTLNTSFANEQEMLSEAYSQEAKPTERMVHGIECAPHERLTSLFFVRPGATTADLTDFDLGQFTVATVGGPSANTNLGSLYVHYEISLFKETLSGGIPSKPHVVRYWKADENVNTAAPFGSNARLIAGSENNITGAPRQNVADEDFQIVNAGMGIQFPRWAYVGSVWKLTYSMTGSSTASVKIPQIIESGLNLEPVGNLVGTPYVATTTAGCCLFAYVRVTGNSAAQRPILELSTAGSAKLPEGAPNLVYFQIENVPQWTADDMGF